MNENKIKVSEKVAKMRKPSYKQALAVLLTTTTTRPTISLLPN